MKKKSPVRLVIQILFFMIVAILAINHSLEEMGAAIPLIGSASIHAMCPFGGVESLYTWITGGVFVKKIHESAFILMGVVFILALLFGPVLCGWVCPFGSLQEWIGKIGKKLFKKRYNTFIPEKLDNLLRFLRYGMLVWVLVMTALSARLFFAEFDPYNALFHLWTGEAAIGGVIALIIVVLSSLIVERPFCKYMCPYGALLGVFNKIRIFKIKRNEKTCISCNKCDAACPMNIKISTKNVVTDHQCISCLKCTSEKACPIENTVTHPPVKFTGPVIALLFILGIGGTMVFNIWTTEGSKIPARFKTGEFAGQSNPADIRGSYTFTDVVNAFDLPLEDLAEAFMVKENPGEYKCKYLESAFPAIEDGEIGTDSVRLFIALYKGMPYTPEEGARLPMTAKSVLSKVMAKEVLNNYNHFFVKINGNTISMPEVLDDSHTDTDGGALSIKGKTTFQEVYDQGITKKQVEEILGIEAGPSGVKIRDYCIEKDIHFSEIKIALQELVDNK